mgnify:FL=1
MKTSGQIAHEKNQDRLAACSVGHVKQAWTSLALEWQAAWEEVGRLGLVPLVMTPTPIGEPYITSMGRAELARIKAMHS